MRDKHVLSHKSDMARVPICLPSFFDMPASLTTISAGYPLLSSFAQLHPSDPNSQSLHQVLS